MARLQPTLSTAGDPRFSSAVRLVGGSSASQGRVEVLRYGTFEPLCGEAFGVRAATVVCRQLGYISDFAVVEPTDSFGSTPAGTSEALYIYNSDGGCSPGASSMYECGLGVTSPSCAMASLTCLGSKGEPASGGYVHPSCQVCDMAALPVC